MKLNVPQSLKLEHDELHVELAAATKLNGPIGEAARLVAKTLHSHFLCNGGCSSDPSDFGRMGLHKADPWKVRYLQSANFRSPQMDFYFLMSVGFWNFLGAGIFGFLINLPIVSYFEVGTILTGFI